MTSAAATATFDTTLVAMGNNTGIEVPDSVLAHLDAGRRPPVRVTLNNYEFRTTVGAMKGRILVPVSKAVREAAGVAAGDALSVTLTVDDTPRDIGMPPDFAAALAAEPAAEAFFEQLSNSLQRYHVDQVTGAKTEATRERRIAKAVQLFLEGKQR